MARLGVRLLVGFTMLLALGLAFASSMRRANAQPRLPGVTRTTLPLTTITQVTLPVTTFPTLVTTPPPSSSASVSPTTRFVVPVTRPRIAASTTTTPSTTTTSTTIAPIPTGSAPPVTLPLASEPQSANINGVFPALSVIGFLSMVGLLTAQWFLTKPGRRGPTL